MQKPAEYQRVLTLNDVPKIRSVPLASLSLYSHEGFLPTDRSYAIDIQPRRILKWRKITVELEMISIECNWTTSQATVKATGIIWCVSIIPIWRILPARRKRCASFVTASRPIPPRMNPPINRHMHTGLLYCTHFQKSFSNHSHRVKRGEGRVILVPCREYFIHCTQRERENDINYRQEEQQQQRREEKSEALIVKWKGNMSILDGQQWMGRGTRRRERERERQRKQIHNYW